MEKYNHEKIEKKWQRKWASSKLYKSKENSKKKKYYVLDMFPYPSGKGLHVGHPKGYIATDIISRYHRMSGYSVLHPMGFDAFGLPAENYALKTKTNPVDSVTKNIKHFKNQLEIIGLDYDWSREINTTDPKYYKWTQWIFLQLFKKGLAYESFESINWCPSCKTGLANEDIENGRCERCGTPVEKKPMRQWVLKITDYADRLLSDLEAQDQNGKQLLDWPNSIKELQKNWIGRSEGAMIKFKNKISNLKDEVRDIEVFTTRPDTLFGVTYMVLAPEHKLVNELLKSIENKKEVEEYINGTKNKNEIERTDAKKEKTGVELKGIKAINPANNEEVSVWIADYVLADYGTGAVMAVPAHDERDWEFAKKFNLSIKEVISGGDIGKEAYIGNGQLINSDKFNGKSSESIKKEITESVGGKWTTTYKLRDWVFSRQRYWGEPIPVIHCENCAKLNPSSRGIVPVPEKDLPVILPKVKSYEPTGTGESPLAAISKWVNVKCPVCKSPAKRETNTMPQWAGSSWYYLRYMDTKNKKCLVDPKKERYWAPVDIYVGGAEHATRHLIYARFWHKFLYDIGVVSNIEPFIKLQHVGLIMGEDGKKMSKRFGNVVNPDDITKTYGADTLRIYEMFMGPFDQQIAWNTSSIIGTRRFIEKVWRLASLAGTVLPTSPTTFPRDESPRALKSRGKVSASSQDCSRPIINRILHQTIKKVTEDIETMRFNTAISSMMILVNEFEKAQTVSKENYEILLQLLAPFAPHIAEELWITLGNKKSIHISEWPKYDPKSIINSEVLIAVQVNGKVRGSFKTLNNTNDEELKDKALNLLEIQKWIKDKEIKKVVIVKNKLVSIVI
jgi:leucyl-tRNA synthetase